jgi:hypothetical protein
MTQHIKNLQTINRDKLGSKESYPSAVCPNEREVSFHKLFLQRPPARIFMGIFTVENALTLLTLWQLRTTFLKETEQICKRIPIKPQNRWNHLFERN